MLEYLPAVATVLSSIMGAQGQSDQGAAVQQQLNSKAAQERQNAGQQVAASQRASLEVARQGQYALSDLIAKAAASGGGGNDPTILNLAGQIKGEQAYKQALALYQGQEASRSMKDQANADEYSGAVQAKSYNMAAGATLMGGAAKLFSMYHKYGGGDNGGGQLEKPPAVADNYNWGTMMEGY